MSEDPTRYKSDPPCGPFAGKRIGPHGPGCKCAFPKWDVELAQNVHTTAVDAVVKYLSKMDRSTVLEALDVVFDIPQSNHEITQKVLEVTSFMKKNGLTDLFGIQLRK